MCGLKRGVIAAACIGLLFAGPNEGIARPQAPAPSSVRQSFDLAVPYAPSPVRIGSRRYLVYELHLTNFARDPLTLDRVRIEDADTGKPIRDLAGERLQAALHIVGDSDASATIAPGRRAIVYLEVPIGNTAPRALRHRVHFSAPGTAPATVTGGEVRVAEPSRQLLGPPLRGGPWVAVYDPDWARGHRRVVYAVGGRATIPGRHAIDWMHAGLPEGGTSESGRGAAVIAVADAVVATTRDGVAEPPAGTPRPPVPIGDATGNYVALDLGDGRYAFYEHLAPGLSVKPGDRVRRGQVIGRLGSTGQAVRPHLHFHVADANSPLAAEGLPFALTGGRVVGRYPSFEAFGEARAWAPATSAGDLQGALPPPMSIVVFDDAAAH